VANQSNLDKKAKLEALRQRKNNRPVKIDNASLPAGSPMYYYCTSCGHLADTMPENWFITPPRSLCTKCQELKDQGWL
jgi:hypothetical protein